MVQDVELAERAGRTIRTVQNSVGDPSIEIETGCRVEEGGKSIHLAISERGDQGYSMYYRATEESFWSCSAERPHVSWQAPIYCRFQVFITNRALSRAINDNVTEIARGFTELRVAQKSMNAKPSLNRVPNSKS